MSHTTRGEHEGHTYPFRNRSQVQRWVERTQEQLEEKQMSWAERHVLWMIENNCDDQGMPWPEQLRDRQARLEYMSCFASVNTCHPF